MNAMKSKIAAMTDTLLVDALMQLRKSPTETQQHSLIRSLLLIEYERRFDDIEQDNTNTQAMMERLGL